MSHCMMVEPVARLTTHVVFTVIGLLIDLRLSCSVFDACSSCAICGEFTASIDVTVASWLADVNL
jgi:hypothetical protein